MAGIIAPNVQNLSIPKGFLFLKRTTDAAFFAVGNCTKVVYTPKVTVLPHFSEMAGTKVQDFSVITQKGGEISFDAEERIANNLALFFLGEGSFTTKEKVNDENFSKLGQD